jgi:hypothetical protein
MLPLQLLVSLKGYKIWLTYGSNLMMLFWRLNASHPFNNFKAFERNIVT